MKTNVARCVFALLTLSICCYLTGCKQSDNNKPEPPQLVLLDVPQALVANVDTFYSYRVKLDNASADSLFCNVTKPDGTPAEGFALYDDGGGTVRRFPSYADSFSGDIAAGNSTFTRRISGRELANGVTGTYHFRFSAGQDVAEQIDVQVQNVAACLITEVPPDTTFRPCFVNYAGTVRITRSEGDHVDTVRATLQSVESSTETRQLLIPAPYGGDTIWIFACTSAFFRCRDNRLSTFNILIEAHTRFGQGCSRIVMPFDYDVGLIPVLSQCTLPDTIYRPTVLGDTDTVVVTLDLFDCTLMGATDYYGLQFDVRREDRTDWSHSADFYLRDDGRPPDSAAGNHTYSVGLTFNRDDSLPNKLYYFRFYAIQFWGCPGATTDTLAYLLDSVRVIQPPPLMRMVQIPSTDFGVVK